MFCEKGSFFPKKIESQQLNLFEHFKIADAGAFVFKNGETQRKCILQLKFAYAIMPVSKKRLQVHLDERTFWGFFLSFIPAKHPVGYLLSFGSLSSHLTMRWQSKPPMTVTKKEITTSIQTPPPCCGFWWATRKLLHTIWHICNKTLLFF